MELLLIGWNAIVFCMYGADKYFSKSDMRRIPEKQLLGAAFLMGAVGALCGMTVFRHKTKKPQFKILVPIALICNLAIWYLATGEKYFL